MHHIIAGQTTHSRIEQKTNKTGKLQTSVFFVHSKREAHDPA